MGLEYQIVLAFMLDLMVGDPRWFPHPVRLMGRAALLLEGPARVLFRSPMLAGTVTCLSVIVAAGLFTAGLMHGAHHLDPMAGFLVGVLIIYTGLAARDLRDHSAAVRRALERGDLALARSRVAMICGRDTDRLDEAGVVRATVESLGENLVDGVTAPVFYAILGGPVGIMIYKAVSTMDSTFGYKTEEYLEFGRVPARLDDVVAFLPSRVTGLLVPVAAFLLGLSGRSALKVFLRDRKKHPSPNAGQCEAAFAGALGLRLGGLSWYGGTPSVKPTLGDDLVKAAPDSILQAERLMLLTSVLFVTICVFLLACVPESWLTLEAIRP